MKKPGMHTHTVKQFCQIQDTWRLSFLYKNWRIEYWKYFVIQDNFYIIVETYHLPDRGNQENVHELEDKKLKKRSVVHIDIANDSVASADYKADEDPKTFKSEKTGRGPLSGDWRVSKR